MTTTLKATVNLITAPGEPNILQIVPKDGRPPLRVEVSDSTLVWLGADIGRYMATKLGT